MGLMVAAISSGVSWAMALRFNGTERRRPTSRLMPMRLPSIRVLRAGALYRAGLVASLLQNYEVAGVWTPMRHSGKTAQASRR